MNDFSGLKIGFAICGSYCTFSKVLPALEALKKTNAQLFPILSENAYKTDTRFGKAKDFCDLVTTICGNEIIHTINDAEPIGPKKMFDIMVICPCTGNTLAKLSHGITDTSVTMAAKAHLRNERPLLLAVSTNDALSNAAPNIGQLLTRKHVFFVPFAQDDPEKKPRSAVADLSQLPAAISSALEGKQLQPIFASQHIK